MSAAGGSGLSHGGGRLAPPLGGGLRAPMGGGLLSAAGGGCFAAPLGGGRFAALLGGGGGGLSSCSKGRLGISISGGRSQGGGRLAPSLPGGGGRLSDLLVAVMMPGALGKGGARQNAERQLASRASVRDACRSEPVLLSAVVTLSRRLPAGAWGGGGGGAGRRVGRRGAGPGAASATSARRSGGRGAALRLCEGCCPQLLGAHPWSSS
jgi:hypothetical protein